MKIKCVAGTFGILCGGLVHQAIAQSTNLVANGGFENGAGSLLSNPTIPSWGTQFAFQNQYAVVTSATYPVHSGLNVFADTSEAYPGTTGLGTLSQNLQTIPGAKYQLTYYLGNFKFSSPIVQNEFQAAVQSVVLSDTKNIPYEQYVQNQNTFTATGNNTLLQFGILNNTGVFLLDDISVSLLSLSLESTPGLTPNQFSIAKALDNAPLTTPVGQVAISTESFNPSTVAANLSALSPEKLQIMHNIAVDNFGFLASQIDDHLSSSRATGGVDLSGLQTQRADMPASMAQLQNRLNDQQQVTAGMDEVARPSAPRKTEVTQPWSAFIAGNVVLADLTSDANVPHSNYTTGGVTAGADYRLDPNWKVGALVGYNHTGADLDNVGSNLKVDTYYPGVYAAYSNDQGWFANGLFTYNYNSYQEKRSIPFLNSNATGSPTGNQYNTDFDGGYELHCKALTYGPVASLLYVHEDIGGFTETGAGGANLAINTQAIDSLRSRLGAQARYRFHFNDSITIDPHILATWQHEYLQNSGQSISGQFAGFGGSPFSVNTSKVYRDAAFVDAGLDTEFNNAVLLFLDYQAQAGQDNYFAQSVQSGVRVSF